MVLTLKILLLDVRPQVWRRVESPGAFTLEDLHFVLQVAMGWGNEHLHQFTVDRFKYSDDEPDERSKQRDERSLRLSDLARKGKSFAYEYDFGDCWRHQIVVEKVDREGTASTATCVAGNAPVHRRTAAERTDTRDSSGSCGTHATKNTQTRRTGLVTSIQTVSMFPPSTRGCRPSQSTTHEVLDYSTAPQPMMYSERSCEAIDRRLSVVNPIGWGHDGELVPNCLRHFVRATGPGACDTRAQEGESPVRLG